MHARYVTLYAGDSFMSVGIGGWAKLIDEDDQAVMYEYGCYNLNDELYRNTQKEKDGIIVISKHAFREPEIHEKIRKRKGGKRYVARKRVHVPVGYSNDNIHIQNCSFCWKTDNNGNDVIARHLIWRILDGYQENSTIPEYMGYHI